jgi:glycosyltransferase involved in cell wall biosynthesis
VHVPDFPQPRRDGVPPNLLFVGNCAGGLAAPNGDGIQWFLANVWPLILLSLPDVRLHVVGHGCADLIPLGTRNVEAHGFIDDLASLYATASCTIAPIRFGTGTRIKILESFAHACPVVSTTMGCDGLEVSADQDLLLGDSAEAFARHCLTLLTDPAARHRLGFAGYCVADRLYNRRRQQADLAHRLLRHIELVRSAN